MIVLVLTACPAGLRGDVTRWLAEIAPGVFAGHVSARVRERLWERVIEGAGMGKGLLVYSSQGAQRLQYRVHNHDWTPTDFEGMTLMLRPRAEATSRDDGDRSREHGWSTASRLRRYGRDAEQLRRKQEEI